MKYRLDYDIGMSIIIGRGRYPEGEKKMKDVKEITKKLEQGVKDVYDSENYMKYLKTMAKFSSYSINNIILIYLQMPEATKVAGYRAWQTKFNRHVKKGEKAITILAPIPHKYTKEVENEDGEKETKEIKWTGFKAVSVFDYSQTEGEELPSLTKALTSRVKNYKELKAKIEGLAHCPISYDKVEGGAKGYYSPSKDVIVIKKGMPQAQTLKTLVHEITHSMLHRIGGAYETASRETMEIQAESVAYVVCNALGIETKDYSFGYVAGWSRDKEVKELQENMETIKRTATALLERLEA